jgi:hypothetical protein
MTVAAVVVIVSALEPGSIWQPMLPLHFLLLLGQVLLDVAEPTGSTTYYTADLEP